MRKSTQWILDCGRSWEMPVESAFSGDEMAYEVGYNDNNLVDEVIALKK